MTDPEFRNAYREHKDVLYRFAWRMTGSPAVAEDLVQDCYLVLLRNPDAYDHRRGTLRSFLIGVTRNLALKWLRGQRGFVELDEEIAAPAIDVDGRSRAELIAQAVASLPPLQREVLILAEYEELKIGEIAHCVDAEIAAVKSRLHRARENLRRMLAPLLVTREPGKKGTAYGAGK